MENVGDSLDWQRMFRKHYGRKLIWRNQYTGQIQRWPRFGLDDNGVKETLTEIRSQYWIVPMRQFVLILLGTC